MTPDNIITEFDDAKLGDERLDARLVQIAVRLAQRPGESFPNAFPSDAELEAFYRFIRNDRVTADGVLEPHVQATVERLASYETAVAIHDTTEFRFKGNRDGLGRLTSSGQGFMGHCSLMVDPAEGHEPLGVAAMYTWVRKKESATAKRRAGKVTYKESRELSTEQIRWGKQVDEVESRVGGTSSLVHVMDSEADDYALFAKLVDDERRFVIRLCYDRVLDVEASGSAPHRKTKSFVASGQTVCTRTVTLSKRKRQPGGGKKTVRSKERKKRQATLAITAKPVVFRRPSSTSSSLPKTLAVNIVQVREANPPKDVDPVEWLLITTEPIETVEQILRVVDYYRVRWTIEEYFKALKTGCAFEARQLDSLRTLLVALAILAPIAWCLLRLRNIARTNPAAPAETALTPTQLEVLRLASEIRLPRKPSAREALLATAKLGGHLNSNGEPGWQVLARGYHELLTLTAGYMLAKRKK